MFLSPYNYLYDYKGEHIKDLGFHDFFFPTDSLSFDRLINEGPDIIFTKGFRVDVLPRRQYYKQKAQVFSGYDSSGCYPFKEFLILPVTISYKRYKDYDLLVCRRNYFYIRTVIGCLVGFAYEHKAIAIKETRICTQKAK